MEERELYESESLHHRMTVQESDGVISLRFNGRLQSSMCGAGGLDTLQPYLHFLHLPLAIAPNLGSVLVVGLGGGILPKRLWHDYPQAHVDVVELDPEVVDVSRRFFGLPDDERLKVIVTDGRGYLESNEEAYDVIVIDAYFETSMPYELTTREFVALCRSSLKAGGVLAYNFVGVLSGAGSATFHRFLKGMRETFSATYVFPVGVPCGGRRQNIIVMASDTLIPSAQLRERVRSRVGGLVTVPCFETFADRLTEVSLDPDTAALTDAEMPEDGLLYG